MKDNDIKKMFENAVESDTDINISTAKIQNTVMERLGKQAKGNLKLSVSEETVEPVFVTPPAKSFRKAPAFIAAAAACLGFTAVSTGFFGLSSTSSTLTGGTSNTLEQTESSVSETKEEYIYVKIPERSETSETAEHTETAAATEAAENVETAVPVQSETAEIEDKNPEETPAIGYENTTEEWIGKAYPLNNNTFTLLDGTNITVEGDKVSGTQDRIKMNLLLTEKDGRLYYGNGKDKKDITDLISTEVPYIDSYKNQESGLTHYIVVGGDVASGKYGYAEVFATYERSWHCSYVLNRMEYASGTENDLLDHEVADMMQNLVDNAVKQISGDQFFKLGGGGGCEDFRSVN